MKTFILPILPLSGLTEIEDGVYQTDVLDLYSNSTYTNYSVTRSAYGTDLLELGIWTGLNILSETETEVGFLDDGRFVDTSGRIEIPSMYLTLPDGYQEAGFRVTVELYFSDTDDESVLEDWPLAASATIGQDFDLVDVDRYMRAIVRVTNPLGLSLDAEWDIDLLINIDKPVAAPMYRSSKRLLDQLPEWMAMREIEIGYDDLGLATPDTVGGTFVNAVAGEWLEQARNDVNYLSFQHFIGTVDINQIDWCYKTSFEELERPPTNVNAGGVALAQAVDLREFYEANPDWDVYYWDGEQRTIFVRKDYDNLQALEYDVVVEPHHVWNWVDDFGVLVDLPRIHLESNEIYRKRILDVYANRPSPGIEAFKLALRRELDIWAVYGATPDSDYSGATPEVLEMSDLESDLTYTTAEGIPTERFVNLVLKLSKQYPTTWGRFVWGRGFWDAGGLEHQGYSTLPLRYDAATPATEIFEAGVGDMEDLSVLHPSAPLGPQEFRVKLKARGLERTGAADDFVPLTISGNVAGSADKVIWENPEVSEWFTVVLEPAGLADFLYQATDGGAVLADSEAITMDNNWEMTFDGELPFDLGDGESVTLITSPVWFLFIRRTGSDVYLRLVCDPGGDGTGGGYVDVVMPWADSDRHRLKIVWEAEAETVSVYEDDDDDNEWVLIDVVSPTATPVSPFPAYGSDDFAGDLVLSPGDATNPGLLYDWALDAGNGTSALSLSEASSGDTAWETDVVEWSLSGYEGGGIYLGSLALATPVTDGFVYTQFELTATSDAEEGAETPSAACYAVFRIFDDVGNLRSDLTWYDSDTDAVEDIGEYASSDIGRIFLYPGKYNPGTEGTTDAPTDTFSAYWSHNTGVVLEFDSDFVVGDADFEPVVYMVPQETSFSTSTQIFEISPYQGVINDAPDGTVSQAFTFTAPSIAWDNDLADPPNKEYVVSVVLVIEGATPSDWFTSFEDADGVTHYVAIDDLYLNGSNTWSIEGQQALMHLTYEEGLLLSFEVASATSYPLSKSSWTLFEYEMDGALYGVADENGPWKNGVPPRGFSGDFSWYNASFTREDFGIPDTDDYIPTWIGLEMISNNNVITWLSSNTVKPVASSDGTTYPANAIEEFYDNDASAYGFEPFVIFARTKSEPDRYWRPRVHSGYFYENEEEFYLYANRKDEIHADPSNMVLQGLARQGAPVIVQVADEYLLVEDSFNRDDNATPGSTDGDGTLDPVGWIDYGFLVEDSALEVENVPIAGTVIDTGLGVTNFRAEMNVDGEAMFILRASSTAPGATAYAAGVYDAGDYWSAGFWVTDTGVFTPITTVPFRDNFSKLSVRVYGDEFVLYVDDAPVIVISDNTLTGDYIGVIARQGARIDDFRVWALVEAATPVTLRPVAFPNGATPGYPTLINTESLIGTGTDTLYLAYDDVYDVSVENTSTGIDITLDTTSDSNAIQVSEVTDTSGTYEVSYKVVNSYVVDNFYSEAGVPLTRVITDFDPSEYGSSELLVTYEESTYDPYYQPDLPLSPLYTSLETGFIYLAHSEYDLFKVVITLAPQKILADGKDFITVTIRSYDIHGNPKPNQPFSLSTTWGTMSDADVITDHDGRVVVLLYADDETSTISNEGTITVSGTIDASIGFEIQPVFGGVDRIWAIASAEEVPSDGESQVTVYGRVYASDFVPRGGETVNWRRARSLYELFAADFEGATVTNDDGSFGLGPFVTSDPDSPGYWFLSVETDEVGDVVFWHEYPISAYGIDDMTGLPIPPIQMATPAPDIPEYTDRFRFPVNYDEGAGSSVDNSATPNWLPPKWYALDWYKQYQLGITSDTPDALKPGYIDDAHYPDRGKQ